MTQEFRCDCPITSALDILGDKWMLVIVKQMLLEDKETFKDFTESDEAIATNILSTKLKMLEELGMVTKSKLPSNKKSVYYHLTDKSLSLTPVLVDLAVWSDENLRELNPIMQKTKELNMMKSDREGMIKLLVDSHKEKTAKFIADSQ